MRTLFLARVPVLCLLAVTLIAALSLFSGIQPTFVGLFTLDNAPSMFLVALGACSVSLGATAAINLILEHGHIRMDEQAKFPACYDKFEPRTRLYLLCQIPTLFFVGCCLRWWPGNPFIAVITAAGGWLAAHIVLGLAIAVEILLSDPDDGKLPNMLVLRLPQGGRIGRWVEQLRLRDPLPSARGIADGFANLLADYALPLLPGYLYKSRQRYKLYPGTVFCGAFSIAAVSIWIGLIWIVSELDLNVYGSLAFVLLAILILLLLLAGLAFFLDRYRIPVSVVVLAYVLLVGASSGTDHLYRVRPLEAGHPMAKFAQPSDVLKRVEQAGTPVVIMTAGGGIQAAAWTTQVLAGMQKLVPDFSRRIVLISSISGGSLGAYYVAAAYRKKKQFEDARQWALKSALDEIAWGLTGPDLMRIFLPYTWPAEVDRGWALERKWDRIVNGNDSTDDFYFDDLAKDTSEGNTPAFIMNATAIEGGVPFIFTSTAFRGLENSDPACKEDPACLRNVKEFNTYNHCRFRVRVSTAARLSASFAYLAPAARSNGHPLAPDYHMVDGGYYDNFGVRSALDWLAEASPEGAAKPDNIALVEIRWGDSADVGGSVRGWNYQGIAPLSGILNVRNNGQRRENDVALEAFRKNWKNAKSFVFSYKGTGSCGSQPLSWKLTKAQSDCVQSTWSSEAMKTIAAGLEKFLK